MKSPWGLTHFLAADQMDGLGGNTETFDADLLHPLLLRQLIEEERKPMTVGGATATFVKFGPMDHTVSGPFAQAKPGATAPGPSSEARLKTAWQPTNVACAAAESPS